MIRYEQFTGLDADLHPEIDNSTYLERKLVKTALSSGICSYGYIKIDGTKYKWIPLEEALTLLKGEEDALEK